MVTKTETPKPIGTASLRRWRVACLLAIHLLFALHVIHWKLRGATLAPLELSESLHTLHDGILTAGFVFALLAVGGTLFFGRFFCGWGCHILALQDGCAWILGNLGIRPKPVRSRTMALIPLGIMAYIYAWPQLVRIWEGHAYPGLHLVRTVDGWGSFATRDLFRAMPGPLFSILTLAVCGGATVYFLGSRSFCYSVCPYGVFFGWAERFAPAARLVLSGGCENCGLCTLNCKSGVKVIQELRQFGTVKDTNCLKSLDCVAGCPSGAIGLGFRLPWTPVGKPKARPRPPKRFDFAWREEMLFLAAFLSVFLVYRGLYEIGIFLAGTLGVIAGAEAIRWLRVRKARKAGKSPSPAKAMWARGMPAALRLAFLAVTAHGAYVHYHGYLGQRVFDRNPADPESVAHLRRASAWAAFPQPGVERALALASAGQGDFATARDAFARYLALRPRDVFMRIQFAGALEKNGQGQASERELGKSLLPEAAPATAGEMPWRATAGSLLAHMRSAAGDTAGAVALLTRAMADDPKDVSHVCNLAYLRIRQKQIPEAKEIMESARNRLGSQPCLQQLGEMATAASP